MKELKDLCEIVELTAEFIRETSETLELMAGNIVGKKYSDEDERVGFGKDLLKLGESGKEFQNELGKLDMLKEKSGLTKEEEAWIAWYLVNPKATSDDALRYEELMKKNNVKKEKKV